jgi:hypothetical protein
LEISSIICSPVTKAAFSPFTSCDDKLQTFANGAPSRRKLDLLIKHQSFPSRRAFLEPTGPNSKIEARHSWRPLLRHLCRGKGIHLCEQNDLNRRTGQIKFAEPVRDRCAWRGGPAENRQATPLRAEPIEQGRMRLDHVGSLCRADWSSSARVRMLRSRR